MYDPKEIERIAEEKKQWEKSQPDCSGAGPFDTVSGEPVELSALEYCQIIPAENQDVIILVTDTPNEETEKALQIKLKKLTSLESLNMTFGHTDV